MMQLKISFCMGGSILLPNRGRLLGFLVLETYLRKVKSIISNISALTRASVSPHCNRACTYKFSVTPLMALYPRYPTGYLEFASRNISWEHQSYISTTLRDGKSQRRVDAYIPSGWAFVWHEMVHFRVGSKIWGLPGEGFMAHLTLRHYVPLDHVTIPHFIRIVLSLVQPIHPTHHAAPLQQLILV